MRVKLFMEEQRHAGYENFDHRICYLHVILLETLFNHILFKELLINPGAGVSGPISPLS